MFSIFNQTIISILCNFIPHETVLCDDRDPPIGKKIPCISPLFEDNEYIADFKKKAELFNSFFANLCSLINNSQLPPTLSYKTNERLSSVKITDDDILKIITKLDQNKAHGHDKISIRMIKMCSTSICKSLRLIFNHCIENGIYPCEWKKANVVPIHKKGDLRKQTLKNYRPVSLLPICSKVFGRLLYNEMFGFFVDKGLISANQSGFKPGDSCINQLLSITHNIYKSFDDGYEVTRYFP